MAIVPLASCKSIPFIYRHSRISGYGAKTYLMPALVNRSEHGFLPTAFSNLAPRGSLLVAITPVLNQKIPSLKLNTCRTCNAITKATSDRSVSYKQKHPISSQPQQIRNETVRYITNLLLVTLVATAIPNIYAQSLGDPSPVNRVMNVNQFGIPSDAKYIFCQGEDCGERTTKTLTNSKPIYTPTPVAELPHPQSVQLPTELLPVKSQLPKPVTQKPKHKKHAVKKDCRPTTAK